MKFNSKIAAALLVLLSAVYMIASMAKGYSAVSETPPDLQPSESGLDVFQAAAEFARHGQGMVILDLRPKYEFRQFHIPFSLNIPNGSVSTLVEKATGAKSALIVAEKDEEAVKLIKYAKRLKAPITFHYLKEGIRSWYLTFELPVPLFNDKPPPLGYQAAMSKVHAWLTSAHPGQSAEVVKALKTLAKAGYQPTSLQSKKKPSTSGKKKKITGGCG